MVCSILNIRLITSWQNIVMSFFKVTFLMSLLIKKNQSSVKLNICLGSSVYATEPTTLQACEELLSFTQLTVISCAAWKWKPNGLEYFKEMIMGWTKTVSLLKHFSGRHLHNKTSSCLSLLLNQKVTPPPPLVLFTSSNRATHLAGNLNRLWLPFDNHFTNARKIVLSQHLGIYCSTKHTK